MSFLGRTRELKALQAAWASVRSGFIPIYGRRRVGKSELIVHFAVCGGVPAYLLAFDGAQSVEQNLITRLLDESAALAREPEFLLHKELRYLVPYHSVLMALAQGKSSPAQLAKSTGIDVRGLNYHLNTLVELGYVQRRYPNARNATIGRRLFVKTAKVRSKARLDGVHVHTLQELYDLDEVN